MVSRFLFQVQPRTDLCRLHLPDRDQWYRLRNPQSIFRSPREVRDGWCSGSGGEGGGVVVAVVGTLCKDFITSVYCIFAISRTNFFLNLSCLRKEVNTPALPICHQGDLKKKDD